MQNSFFKGVNAALFQGKSRMSKSKWERYLHELDKLLGNNKGIEGQVNPYNKTATD